VAADGEGVMAKVNRPNAPQDYCTPADFLDAIAREYGSRPTWDAACEAHNCVVPQPTEAGMSAGYVHTHVDALARDWSELHGELVWCNPPFAKAGEFCRKAAEAQASGPVHILMLVQASVDTNWFREHVHGRAFVRPLSPRLTFRGQTAPINRALMLAEYGFGRTGFEPWRWK
jgi:hypothetical protein